MFKSGKRALVAGTMRRVCLTCSSSAVRVVQTVTTNACESPCCTRPAALCTGCVEARVRADLHAPLMPAVAALRAMARGLMMVAPADDGEPSEYVRGKVEGIESALALLEGRL
jgi:hypothetical protein